MNIDEFLAWDATQSIRRELVHGEVFAMAAAEDRHNIATMNFVMALRQHLKGGPCRTYMLDMKLRVDALTSIFYPDVMVTCSPQDRANRLVKREPVLVIEVLSPSTAAYDRGDKFVSYRQIASLREYVLVDLDTRRTDVYRKGDEGLWVLHPFGPVDAVTLASVDLVMTADQLFAEIDIPTEPPA